MMSFSFYLLIQFFPYTFLMYVIKARLVLHVYRMSPPPPPFYFPQASFYILAAFFFLLRVLVTCEESVRCNPDERLFFNLACRAVRGNFWQTFFFSLAE